MRYISSNLYLSLHRRPVGITPAWYRMKEVFKWSFNASSDDEIDDGISDGELDE